MHKNAKYLNPEDWGLHEQVKKQSDTGVAIGFIVLLTILAIAFLVVDHHINMVLISLVKN